MQDRQQASLANHLAPGHTSRIEARFQLVLRSSQLLLVYNTMRNRAGLRQGCLPLIRSSRSRFPSITGCSYGESFLILSTADILSSCANINPVQDVPRKSSERGPSWRGMRTPNQARGGSWFTDIGIPMSGTPFSLKASGRSSRLCRQCAVSIPEHRVWTLHFVRFGRRWKNDEIKKTNVPHDVHVHDPL